MEAAYHQHRAVGSISVPAPPKLPPDCDWRLIDITLINGLLSFENMVRKAKSMPTSRRTSRETLGPIRLKSQRCGMAISGGKVSTGNSREAHSPVAFGSSRFCNALLRRTGPGKRSVPPVIVS